jgi:hypothetical protein
MLVKVKCAVAQIAIEGLDEENGLGVAGRNVLNGVCVEQLQPDGIQRIDGVVAQKLLDGTKFAGLSKPANGMALVADYNSIRFGQLFGDLGLTRGLYDAWLFRGDRSYCLILYRSAL